jgi:hypothetical protein
MLANQLAWGPFMAPAEPPIDVRVLAGDTSGVIADADVLAGTAVILQLPLIEVIGTVSDVLDWLVAFARIGVAAEIKPTGWIRYAIPAQRRHYAMPAEERRFALAPEAPT